MQPVWAIGISPARIEVPFEPNFASDFQFSVFNNVGIPISVEVYKTGNLSDYITLAEPIKFNLDPGQTKTSSFRLALPADIGEPGKHEARVGALEGSPDTSSQGASLGARAAVEMQVWIMVPYPGKYAQVSLEAQDADVGKPVSFVITVKNFGTEAIQATDEIDIYEGDTLVDTVKASGPPLSLKSGNSGQFTASWIGEKAGEYRAVAKVNYDGNQATGEATFRLGQLVIDIVSLQKVAVEKGQIAELRPTVMSRWNSNIKGVYADIEILQNGKTVAKARSETFDVSPWQSKTFSIFIKTENLSIGTYDANLKIYYSGQTANKQFYGILEIAKTLVQSGEVSFMLMLMWIAIIVVIVVIVVMAIIATKLFRHKKEKKAKTYVRKKAREAKVRKR